MTQICPFLGVPGDREVHYGYANALNVCYAGQSAWSRFQPLELGQQQQLCLTPDHIVCPNYLRPARERAQRRRQQDGQTYLQFFGLREEPFSIVPQARFACDTESQRLAHAGLRWLIDQRQGLGVLYGPVGTGKTLLCHTLHEELAAVPKILCTLLLTPSYRSEYVLVAELLRLWKVTAQQQRSVHDLETAAHQFLAEATQQGQTVVLIVDEAQSLSRALLNEICKLLNWQDGGQQLLQVVLAGQPGLKDRLVRLPALRDRAVVEYELLPMSPDDVQRMIGERLARAGRQGDLFTPSAMQLIYKITYGLPRRVTIACLLSLWAAYEEGKRQIGPETVQMAIERAGRLDEAAEMAEWTKGTGEPAPSTGHPQRPASVRLPGVLQKVWSWLGA